MDRLVTIVAASLSDMEAVRELWVEYWKWLDFSPCFQDFDKELESLPGHYAPPEGCILLAFSDSALAGSVALRKLDDRRCEMKRLYVRPPFRGEKIGLALTNAIIEEGRKRGYAFMRLDTLPSMEKAVSIYRALNFVDIEPYTSDPIPGAKYMELDLREQRAVTPAVGSEKKGMIRVLFVCVENSCRSQIAEAFARMHGRGRIEAHSAGSRASGTVNPRAVESMREIGYDLTTHRSKSLNEVATTTYDCVVTMGCGDECPVVPAQRREDWAIPDPKDMLPEEFRKIRDQIDMRVKKLLASVPRRSE